MNIRSLLALAPVIPVLTIENVDRCRAARRAHCAPVGCVCWKSRCARRRACRRSKQCAKRCPMRSSASARLRGRADFVDASNAGAQFGVSPGLTAELAAAAAEVARSRCCPGVMTPTELHRGPGLGLRHVQAVSGAAGRRREHAEGAGGPFPEVVFCPTGGITRATAPDFLALTNVACVGGSWVAPAERVRAGDWQAIEELARDAASLRTVSG